MSGLREWMEEKIANLEMRVYELGPSGVNYETVRARMDVLREWAKWLRDTLTAVPASGAAEPQIKYMVDRFLGWQLPENFNPDAGISFERGRYPMPTGTNLFDATQAEAMIRYLVDGIPEAEEPPKCSRCGKPCIQGKLGSWMCDCASTPFDAASGAKERDALRGEETIREDERQACWEDVMHVLDQAIRDKSKLRDVRESIWLQGWKGFGTGDGKPMHRRSDSHVAQWRGGQ